MYFRETKGFQTTAPASRSRERDRAFRPFEDPASLLDDLFSLPAESRSEHHTLSTAASAVENKSFLYRKPGHFFQAEGLGTELHPIIKPASLTSFFVFYDDYLTLRGYFYRVGYSQDS